MILDKLLQFSDAQALTATAVSTNDIDLSLDRDVGIGEPMAVVVTVGVAADYTTTDETYQVQLLTDDNSSFSSATTIAESQTFSGDVLTIGESIVLPLPQTNERYLRVNYVLAGTTPSVTVDAHLVPLSHVDAYRKYASGYTV